MKWADLTRNQRLLIAAGCAVALLALLAGAFVLGRDTAPPEVAGEPTATVEPTATAEPTAAALVPEPAPKLPSPPAPQPGPATKRYFGQLKGFRDMSGGAWQELYVDIDEATYLTGQEALDWLTARGDAEFYRAEYWYADIGGAAIRSLRIAPAGSAAPVKVVMYRWPTVPAPGFYGPSMTEQNVEFAVFYDAIMMDSDSDGLLNRYYWFTVTGDYLTRIEEQPRDPFYEP